MACGSFQWTFTSVDNRQSIFYDSLSPARIDNDKNCSLGKPVHVRQLPERARNWSGNMNEIFVCVSTIATRKRHRKKRDFKIFSSSFFLLHEVSQHDTKHSFFACYVLGPSTQNSLCCARHKNTARDSIQTQIATKIACHRHENFDTKWTS